MRWVDKTKPTSTQEVGFGTKILVKNLLGKPRFTPTTPFLYLQKAL